MVGVYGLLLSWWSVFAVDGKIDFLSISLSVDGEENRRTYTNSFIRYRGGKCCLLATWLNNSNIGREEVLVNERNNGIN